MIANGGKLVTPHIADDVEQTGNDGQPVRILRKFGAQPPQPDRRRPDRAHDRPARALRGDARGDRHVVGRLRQLPGRDRRQDGHAPRRSITLPGYPNPVKLDQSWWCGYGPYDAPTIVVCAVIENGGHGGTAAAPAALKVFEQYFNTSATTSRPTRATDEHRSRRHASARAAAAPQPRGRRRDSGCSSAARLDPARRRSRRSSRSASGRSTGSRCTTRAAPRSARQALYAAVGASLFVGRDARSTRRVYRRCRRADLLRHARA